MESGKEGKDDHQKKKCSDEERASVDFYMAEQAVPSTAGTKPMKINKSETKIPTTADSKEDEVTADSQEDEFLKSQPSIPNLADEGNG